MATDNFNRADGGLGTNWTDQFTGGGLTTRIISNQANEGSSSSDGALAFWNASAFANDQYAELAISGIEPSGGYVGPTVRCSGTNGSLACYIGMALTSGRARIYKATAGFSFPGTLVVDLGTISGAAWVDGDVVRIEAQGTTLRMYRNGVQIGTDTTDASLASGSAGLFVHGPQADDWAGGDLGGDTTPPTLSSRVVPTGGVTLTATLSESGCTPSSGTGGFTLGGTSATVASWAISSTTLTLTLTGTVYSGQTVTLTYARASTTDDIQDAAGNFLADFSAASVTNNSTQTQPLTAGTASFVSSGTAGIVVTATDATGGTGPYTYQWQRNASGGSYSDISNGSGVSGATTLTLTDGSAVAGTLYGYKLVYTDSAGSPATVTSNAVTAQVYTGGTLATGGFGRGGMNGGING